MVGVYAWRTYESTKQRPLTIVVFSEEHGNTADADRTADDLR
jgi:hypothetical protein